MKKIFYQLHKNLGIVYEDDKVNCYLATDVGVTLQSEIDGGDFTSYKLALKKKCGNFESLKKPLKINNKAVVLEPYKLFQRMSVAAERKLTVADSLQYELTVYPASLFDNGMMRDSPWSASEREGWSDRILSKRECVSDRWRVVDAPGTLAQGYAIFAGTYIIMIITDILYIPILELTIEK